VKVEWLGVELTPNSVECCAQEMSFIQSHLQGDTYAVPPK